ncbi:MAG: DUF4870 domain-containing protein [Planctomycetia bacterium]|nr:DUF4870 domain-containing protein [Planctomycetia bacterium]
MATDPSPVQPQPAPPDSPPASQDENVPVIESNADERQLGMMAHLAGILPFGGFLAPLGLWAAKMGQSAFVEDQAKESLNFQINVTMITVLAAITCAFYVGIVLFPAVVLANAFFCYQGGMAAKEGKVYRYPYTVRYIT